MMALTWEFRLRLAQEVNNFTSACEHLIAAAETHRQLTEDEMRLIVYYCNEMIEKFSPDRGD